MAFQPCPDIVQVNANYTWAGERVENVFHFFRASPGVTAVEVQSLADAVQTTLAAHLMPNLGVELTLNYAYGRDLTTQFSFAATSVGSPTPGTVTGGTVPNNVSLALSWRTGVAGRGNRGRSYVPGIPLSAQAGNLINGTFATAVIAAYSLLLSPPLVSPYALVVLSRHIAGVLRPTGVPIAITTLIAVDLEVDSQRDRLPGHKRKSHGP